MEVISKRVESDAICSFCERGFTEIKFLFRQGRGTMCPDCVAEIKVLMDESEQEVQDNELA